MNINWFGKENEANAPMIMTIARQSISFNKAVVNRIQKYRRLDFGVNKDTGDVIIMFVDNENDGKKISQSGNIGLASSRKFQQWLFNEAKLEKDSKYQLIYIEDSNNMYKLEKM